jgi:Cyclic nucleotide-binding domain
MALWDLRKGLWYVLFNAAVRKHTQRRLPLDGYRAPAPRPALMALPAHRPLLAAPAASVVISLHALKTRCSNCSMRELCLPIGLEQDALQQLDELVAKRVQLKKGEALYRAGDSFTALYAIRTGSCKTTMLAEDGREQVAGYHMLGDVIGMDGIGTENRLFPRLQQEGLIQVQGRSVKLLDMTAQKHLLGRRC